MVPLLQLDDGSVVTESIVVARKVASLFAPEQMLPTADAPAIDGFVDLWTKRVEPDYYGVLKADSDSQSRYKASVLLESLAAVEDMLWQRKMLDS